MSNFEKRLLDKLPEYYDAGLIDTFSEQRLRTYLSEKSAASGKFFTTLLIYILAAAVAILGVFLLLQYNWENFQDVTKLVIGFIPLLFSAVFGILYFAKFFKNALFADIAAILNLLGVIAAVLITNDVFYLYGSEHHAWATIILTALPIPFIFSSSLSALFLIILTLSNSHFESAEIQNLFCFANVILAFFIYKKSYDDTRAVNFVSYILLCLLLPFIFFVSDIFSGFVNDATFFALGAAIPLLKFAKQKELKDAVPICFSWIWIIAFVYIFYCGSVYFNTMLSIRAFFESLKEMHNLNFLAIGSFYAANFYFVCKFFKSLFDKKTNKAYVVLSAVGFFPIFLLNTMEEKVDINTVQNFICAYVFLSAFAFVLSAIRRKSFVLLNCGSLLVVVWAVSKFFSDNLDSLSVSKSLLIAGICIAALNFSLSKLLKNIGE